MSVTIRIAKLIPVLVTTAEVHAAKASATAEVLRAVNVWAYTR